MDASHISLLHDSADRLSELADSFVLVILSFLPMIDVVRTTILSRRWKDLWTTVPCLHFRLTTYGDYDQFRKLIFWSLMHWKCANILKFSIDILFDISMVVDIDLLLLYAISKQVEDLELHLPHRMWPFQTIGYYCPDQRLYSCSSITKLSLSYVDLKIVERVMWNQLKSLTIEGADSLTEHTMNQIISGAPLLEILNLIIEDRRESLSIRSTSLNMVKINMSGYDNAGENETVLRICAPNLQILEISGISFKRCLLNAPSLTNAVLGFDELDYFTLLAEMLREVVLSICHVEKLSLTDWCIKFLVDEMKKDNSVLLFSNAKILKLYPAEANGLLDVVDMFPELMILIIEHNEMQLNAFFQDADECDAHNSVAPKTIFPDLSILQLKTVDITWNVRDAALIIQVVEILLGNSHVLEKMVLRLRNHEANPDSLWSKRRCCAYQYLHLMQE